LHGYLLGRPVRHARDSAEAAMHYMTLVAQGKNVRLWDEALRQQIYLGDDAFVARMQTLADPTKMDAPEVRARNASFGLCRSVTIFGSMPIMTMPSYLLTMRETMQ
jgi:hypothetical protein